MTDRRHTCLWLAAALLLTAASTSAGEVDDYDRSRLWNECRSMDLVVENLSDNATTIGLTRDAIEITVRSRLRSARLYSEDFANTAYSSLYVNVHVVGRAFSSDVSYSKYVKDLASMLEFRPVTWSVSSTGTHGEKASYILSIVTQLTDAFIDEYLRVNEDSCK